MSEFVIRATHRLEFDTGRDGYKRFEVGDTLPTSEHTMALVRAGYAEEVHVALAEAADGETLPEDPGEWPGAVILTPPPSDLDPSLVDLSDEDIDALSPEQLRVEVALRQIITPDRKLPTLRAALRDSRYTVQDDAVASATQESIDG